jgi:2-methylisocitrate lyase-like PEP mutase family enzyme
MIVSDVQRQKASAFLVMHHGPPVLVLGNAWDAISARIHEIEGFRAIGTTSAGVAAALGFPDGQRMSLEQNLAVARCITACVEVPVSVDIEAGYGGEPEAVAAAARAVVATGAVGLNLEDATGEPAAPLYEPAQQVERIRAARAAAQAEDIPLVINARTDVLLAAGAPGDASLRQTISRASAYHAAGADCVFVPSFQDLDRATLKTLVAEIAAPLNIIAGARTPPISELEALGVARVSFGPRPMRVLLASLRRIARELHQAGTYDWMDAESLSYAEVNEMLAGRRGQDSGR